MHDACVTWWIQERGASISTAFRLSAAGFQQICLEWEQNTQWVAWQFMLLSNQQKNMEKGGGKKKCQQCVFSTSAGEQLEWVRSTLWLPQLLLCSNNRIENTLGKMQARDSHAVTLAQHIFQPGTAQGFPEVVCSYLIASYRSRYTPIITHLLLHKCLEDPTSS